jgi:hypothetical protein
MKLKFLKTALVSLALSVSSLANAGLIEQRDWLATDDMVYVEDTGLEWLNINYSVGSTYNSLSSRLAVNGDLEGFRIATTDEVYNMFSAFGLDNLSYLYSGTPTANDQILADYFIASLGEGISQWNTYYYGSINLAYNTTTGKYDRKGLYYYNNQANLYNETFPEACCNGYSANQSNPYQGVYLVKNATSVPEPSTLAILALGMIGLASRRFKKQS